MTTFLILFILINSLVNSQAKTLWKNGITVANLDNDQINQLKSVPRSHFSIIEDVIIPRDGIPANVQIFMMYFGVDRARATVNPNATMGLFITDLPPETDSNREPVIISVREPLDLSGQDTMEAGRSGVVGTAFYQSLYLIMGQLSNGTYISQTDWVYRTGQTIGVAAIPLPAPKKGHTAVHFFPDPTPSQSGVLLLFGGQFGTTYYNDLWENYLVGSNVKTNTSLPTGPSARAWHTSLVSADGNMYLFGGKDGTQYFNDLWAYNYYTQIWTNLSPAGGPSPRAGQVMLFSGIKNTKPAENNENSFYIYGGEDGNTVFNDFWMYNISTNSWMLVDDPWIPKPIARAYHAGFAYVGYDSGDSYFIFFGGIDKDFNTTSSFTIVNLDLPFCQISCPVADGQCIPYALCYDDDILAPECKWDNTNRFKCGWNCTNTAKGCSVPNDCGSGVQCWDGQCADTRAHCNAIPNCDAGMKRCADGRCSTENDPLCTKAPECPIGTTICANGECKAECDPYSGCLPDDKPVQCGNGLCAASAVECNKNCSAQQKQCIEGCQGACDLPDWMWYSEPYDFLSVIGPHPGDNKQNNNFNSHGTPGNPELFGFVFNRAVYNYTDYFLINVAPLTKQEIEMVGPHPYWTSAFEPELLTIAWKITLTSRDRISAQNISVDMGIRPRSSELATDRNDTDHAKDYYCVAAPALWYWDSFDLSNYSQIQDLSYISEFRRLSDMYPAGSYPGEDVYEPPGAANISKPLLRWKCLTDPQFGWPLIIGVDESIQRYGIHLTVDSGVYALLYLPGYSFIDQPDPILPKDRPANFAVLAIGAIILFVLILVVGYKVLVQKK